MAGKRQQKEKLRLDIQSGIDDLPTDAVGPGAGIEFVRRYFPLAQDRLRIATGYFSVAGYKIGLANLSSPDILLHFLVGPDEGVNAKDAVARRLREELDRGDSGDLVAAVEDLIERIVAKKFVIQDAREVTQLFHCKFYVCDDVAVWHGSANFSDKGLRFQAEQVQASRDPELIARWTIWFEEVASQSRDLIDEILAELNAWLEMATPFDAYLKALLILFGLPNSPYEKGAYQPTYYQNALITWAIRRLSDHRGALLVVATGLGKTVIGSEIAARLYRTREVLDIVLISPPIVHLAWRKQLITTRNLPAKLFGCNSLNNKISGQEHHAADTLLAKLNNATPKQLIIIDEAHIYRNELQRLSAGEESRVLDRLRVAIDNGAKVVLLTGSVYGTSIQNVNSLLALLPPRPATGETEENKKWEIMSYQELSGLPLVSVLAVPHVLNMARQRKDVDAEQHPYVEFIDKERRIERNYLPRKIRSRLVSFKPPFLMDAIRVLDGNCCNQLKRTKTRGYDDDKHESVEHMTDSALNQAIDSWLSSPIAFLHRLRRNLETPGKNDLQLELELGKAASLPKPEQVELALDARQITVDAPPMRGKKKASAFPRYRATMRLSKYDRSRELMPLVLKLEGNKLANDEKLTKLIKIIDERCRANKAKVLIFVEMYATAVYLEKSLKKSFGPKLDVACTVTKNGDRYVLKSVAQRKFIQGRFAPKANDQKEPGDHNVLICTDADGIGVNLQDSDTVVNYDLTGGADILVQRLGRILRPTTDAARLPYLYTFIPDWGGTPLDSRTRLGVEKRFARFRTRNDKSSAIMSTPILGTMDEEDLVLDGDIDTEGFFTAADSLTRLGDASIAAHITKLEEHRARASSLGERVMSARVYSEPHHRLVLIFEAEGFPQPIRLIFNPTSSTIESEEEMDILRFLACTESSAKAPVTPGLILQKSTEAIACWGEKHGVAAEDTKRLITLYLLPEADAGENSEFLNSIRSKDKRKRRF